MGEDESTGDTAVSQNQDPAQIGREIEQTREQLGDTVEALVQKTDVKARAKEKLEDTKATFAEKKERMSGR